MLAVVALGGAGLGIPEGREKKANLTYGCKESSRHRRLTKLGAAPPLRVPPDNCQLLVLSAEQQYSILTIWRIGWLFKRPRLPVAVLSQRPDAV